MANRTVSVRAWETLQQMEAAYIAGDYAKATALSAMAQAYTSVAVGDIDDALTAWFTNAQVNGQLQSLLLTVETVTGATAPTDAEVTWDMGDGASRAVTNKVLASNVATLTFAGNHNLAVGQKVLVALTVADAVFDGLQTITAVTATTISFAKVNANVATAAATGTAKLAGLSLTYTWATNGTYFAVATVDTSALGPVTYGRYVRVPYVA